MICLYLNSKQTVKQHFRIKTLLARWCLCTVGVVFKTEELILLKHDDHTSAIDMKVGGKIRKKQEKARIYLHNLHTVKSIHYIEFPLMHKTMNIHGESFVLLFTCMETLHHSAARHPAPCHACFARQHEKLLGTFSCHMFWVFMHIQSLSYLPHCWGGGDVFQDKMDSVRVAAAQAD